jgi:hypothetical protein
MLPVSALEFVDMKNRFDELDVMGCNSPTKGTAATGIGAPEPSTGSASICARLRTES